MESNEKQHVCELLKTKDYKQLYQTQSQIINEMLLIDSQEDFEDFLQENDLDENVFWLYYSAIHGESLMIGGYDEDVTVAVEGFLQEKLTDNVFDVIKNDIQQIYVDLGTRDNLEERIKVLNRQLEKHGYLIRLDYDETYCAGVYFLSVDGVLN